MVDLSPHIVHPNQFLPIVDGLHIMHASIVVSSPLISTIQYPPGPQHIFRTVYSRFWPRYPSTLVNSLRFRHQHIDMYAHTWTLFTHSSHICMRNTSITNCQSPQVRDSHRDMRVNQRQPSTDIVRVPPSRMFPFSSPLRPTIVYVHRPQYELTPTY